MKNITTCLWFDGKAQEAVEFYTSIFPKSKVGDITYYGKAGQEVHGHKEGQVLTVDFTLGDSHFVALNGGPYFKFNEAISLTVVCENQNELDHYWEKLRAGGDPKADQCGWLKDKYGVSWQVTPSVLHEMMKDPDLEKKERVFAKMMTMKKLDIEPLITAYQGR